MPNPIRDDIETKAAALVLSVRQTVRGNTDGLFAEAYTWQILKKMADDEYKKAEQALRDAELIDEDDDIRDLGPGDHTVESSTNFSMQAKVKNAGLRFNKDKFIAAVARKHRVPLDKLIALSNRDAVKDQSKAPLEKTIVEL